MLDIRNLGLIPYEEALDLQERLQLQRRRNEIKDTILLLEHPAVITQGRRASRQDILAPPATLRKEGVEMHRIARGGETTYHGPGQLIGYLIIQLAQIRRVAALVHGVEEILMALLIQEYAIEAQHHQQRPGVWVKGRKIAAVGLAIQHGITSHGFSLNVSPNLSHYQWIVACGMKAEYYTSITNEHPGGSIALSEVQQAIAPYLQRMYRSYSGHLS